MCENMHVEGVGIASKSSGMMTAEMINNAEITAKKVENDYDAKEKLIRSQDGDVTLVPGVSALTLQQKAALEKQEEQEEVQDEEQEEEELNHEGNSGINASATTSSSTAGAEEEEPLNFNGPGTSTILIGGLKTSPGVKPQLSDTADHRDFLNGVPVFHGNSSFLEQEEHVKEPCNDSNWTTYSTTFKHPIETKKKFDLRQKKQVDHLIDLMNAPTDIENVANVHPIITKNSDDDDDDDDQTSLVEQSQTTEIPASLLESGGFAKKREEPAVEESKQLEQPEEPEELKQQEEPEKPEAPEQPEQSEQSEQSEQAETEEPMGEPAIVEPPHKPSKEPENQINMDITKLSTEELAALLSKVNNAVQESKAAISKLQKLISAQEESYHTDALIKKQHEKEMALRKQLSSELRGQLNGAMAARNTLDKCLETLKVRFLYLFDIDLLCCFIELLFICSHNQFCFSPIVPIMIYINYV